MKHEMLKDLDARSAEQRRDRKRLGIDIGHNGTNNVDDENRKAMIRLLDRIEALEAKLK